jgi:predicted nucleic acid-binding protein
MSGPNVVDSSGWLEYLIGTERSTFYAEAIADTENLIVPVISIYEVVKRTLRDSNKDNAMKAVNAMIQGQLVDLDLSLTLEAARYKLPLANNIIYATARRFSATLWTQDADFRGFPNVQYLAK